MGDTHRNAKTLKAAEDSRWNARKMFVAFGTRNLPPLAKGCADSLIKGS